MISYRKIQIKGENSPLNGLWYARPVISDTLDTAALAKHMSKHNTPFSPGVIKGVLTDMIACIKELILDGKNVKLDDLRGHRQRPRRRERRSFQGVGTRQGAEAACPCHGRTE